jgi:hypothetical protein
VLSYAQIAKSWIKENGFEPKFQYELYDNKKYLAKFLAEYKAGAIIPDLDTYLDSVDPASVIRTARQRAAKKILNTPKAKALFEYIFDLEEPSMLLSIYTFLSSEDKINLTGLFSSSIKIAKSAFESAVYSHNPNYVSSDRQAAGGIEGQIKKARDVDLSISPEIWPILIKTPLLILKGMVEQMDPAHNTLKQMKIADQMVKDAGIAECGLPMVEQHHTLNDHPYLYLWATPPGVIFGVTEFLSDFELASKKKAARAHACPDVPKEKDC